MVYGKEGHSPADADVDRAAGHIEGVGYLMKNNAPFLLVEGQQLAWWGMDIAEIRWMIVEVLRGNIAGFGVLAAFIALAVFYFKSQKKEEQEAAVRMGWVAEEK